MQSLAYAGLDRLNEGEWRLHSRFTHAINFSQADGTLMTFIPHGKGAVPAGVTLSTRDFARVQDVTRWVKLRGTLHGENIMIHLRRKLTLRPASGRLFAPDLAAYSEHTGLCGSLREICAQAHASQLLLTGLELWSRGTMPEWHDLLGRGPGLTPSGDDMLVGALAVLQTSHFAPQLSHRPFLPPNDQLITLTTSVSCSYLNSARGGEFSTPVLCVLRRLQRRGDPHRAIRRLLLTGHTSGADMLAGMVLTLRWLQASDLRREYARSGNSTHIYTRSRDREFLASG
jgi:hypothetical protein